MYMYHFIPILHYKHSYLNSLNFIPVILLFYVIIISNRTDISDIFYIVFDAFCHHLINEYGIWTTTTHNNTDSFKRQLKTALFEGAF